ISVLELVHAFERASGRRIPYEIVERRPGDSAEVFADPALAQQLLGWRAQYDVDAMCRDAWHWQAMNPQGYRSPLRRAAAPRVERPRRVVARLAGA
ncbi:MAG: UDP-glucose 4-epimerase GalE, partial [Xanthomonas sp.]